MTADELMDLVVQYGAARADSAYAARDGDERESVRRAGVAQDALGSIRTEVERLRDQLIQFRERERNRLAAYLYSIIQSAENSEDGEAQTPLEKAYDNGILYAARMLLDGADEGAPWTEHAEEYAEELRRRVVPGEPAFDNNALLVEDLEPDVDGDRVMLRGDGGWLVANLTQAAARDLAEAIREAADEVDDAEGPEDGI